MLFPSAVLGPLEQGWRNFHDTNEYDRFHVLMTGVPFESVGILRTTLLLHITCMRSYCNSKASCVAALQTKNEKVRWKAWWQQSNIKCAVIEEYSSRWVYQV